MRYYHFSQETGRKIGYTTRPDLVMSSEDTHIVEREELPDDALFLRDGAIHFAKDEIYEDGTQVVEVVDHETGEVRQEEHPVYRSREVIDTDREPIRL